ncbi:hypothetical protein BJX68DRAFT_108227 [Aspergillus pseudodeflectus]|uniref:Uncharacterized protein n=1 Tax=Aspergillus pseudodeflectus TaxID=176178 RepID=A0ABR4K7D4_9EURO
MIFLPHTVASRCMRMLKLDYKPLLGPCLAALLSICFCVVGKDGGHTRLCQSPPGLSPFIQAQEIQSLPACLGHHSSWPPDNL